jgi:hypothetical protein
MAAQGAEGAGLRIEDEGHGICRQAALPHRDEEREGMGPHEGVLDVEAVLAEVRRLVHGHTS